MTRTSKQNSKRRKTAQMLTKRHFSVFISSLAGNYDFVYWYTQRQTSTLQFIKHIYEQKLRAGLLTRYSEWLRPGRFGIETRWERVFPPVQTRPEVHPASCKMGTGSFPRVKCGRDVLLTTHPLLVPRSWKCRAIPLPTLWATPGL